MIQINNLADFLRAHGGHFVFGPNPVACVVGPPQRLGGTFTATSPDAIRTACASFTRPEREHVLESCVVVDTPAKPSIILTFTPDPKVETPVATTPQPEKGPA